MRSGALCVLAALLVAPVVPNRAAAQDWNDSRALSLVRRAADRRAQQLADSGLVDYRATAHGYVTFLAQLGDGFLELPRVVKADELALQVYWRAPNLSKQRVIGRRDTTLLPTDIAYHRDHLGIVQNNFPAIIRIGEGDEVRDVPHPLSRTGLSQYDFALTDSLRITLPGRVIDVYEVKVRPFDDEQPRILGAIYLDRAGAQVVRMAFSFTRAAYVDKQLENVFVVLENGLVSQRFWLPRRQEIEIRRAATWLDYPMRGVIRGRWEIGDYALNVETPPQQFAGPEIVLAPPAELRAYQWQAGKLLDSLPAESRLATPTEIRRVQEEARAVVRAQMFGRPRGMLSARGVSDLLRFDRNSGLSVGAGFNVHIGGRASVIARGRHGIGDQRGHGSLTAEWTAPSGLRFSIFGMDDVREAGDIQERSSLVNSLAAQEFSSDFTDLYGVSGWGFGTALQWAGTEWSLSWAAEQHRALSRNARSFRDTLPPAFDADSRDGHTTTLRIARRASVWRGIEWRARVEGRLWLRPAVTLSGSDGTCCVAVRSMSAERGTISAEAARSIGAVRLASRTFFGVVTANKLIRTQDLFYLGGPMSAPGYAFHDLIGDRAFAQNTELQLPIPAPALPLGRFGRLPGRATLAVHGDAAWVRRVPVALLIQRTGSEAFSGDLIRTHPDGWSPSAGVSLTIIGDLLRLDASRPTSSGRWRFSIDLTRPYWGIL